LLPDFSHRNCCLSYFKVPPLNQDLNFTNQKFSLIRKEFPAREEPSGWMTFGAKNWEHCDKKWEYVGASWTYGWSVVLDT
jgi:hypothetical protein